MMAAYYNEYDPKAAAWLRELIKQGHIADGVVDDRSIEDVRPDELAGFTQCHFFAGIGVWSYALRQAGWADDRAVWTGSCPCQPFSAAGKGAGFADERHLWPAFHHLISQCQPSVVLGEQVASKDGLAWLDLVLSDLEATGYASGAVDLCAAGVGAPHIRQRLWWVGTRLGNTDHEGSQEHRGLGELHLRKPDRSDQGRQHIHTGLSFGMADSDGDRRNKSVQQVQGSLPEWFRGGHFTEWLADPSGIRRGAGGVRHNGGDDGRQPDADVKDAIGLADTDDADQCGQFGLHAQDGSGVRQGDSGSQLGLASGVERPSPTNGHWRDADWLFCRDGKWRPVVAKPQPLVDGAAARVGRLRGYGNAIAAQAAQAFIESVMD